MNKEYKEIELNKDGYLQEVKEQPELNYFRTNNGKGSNIPEGYEDDWFIN